MNTENYREDYTFIAWASGNKRSRYGRATLTIQPAGVDDEIRLCYIWGRGWAPVYWTDCQLLKRITSDCTRFCNLLFKYLVKEDIYGTKIKWENDGTLRDVSIY